MTSNRESEAPAPTPTPTPAVASAGGDGGSGGGGGDDGVSFKCPARVDGTGRGGRTVQKEKEDSNDKDSKDINDNSNYTVGVYYYPWYGKDFHGGKYLRGDLIPPQPPVLGEYDDTDPMVISRHLEWTRNANINLWVTSWWGPNSKEDYTTKNVIMEHPNLPGTKIALFYETMGRMKDTSMCMSTANVWSDLDYISKNYFDHPNFLRIDGRPVLFVYLTRVLDRQGLLEKVVSLMRGASSANGHDVYILGDQVFGELDGIPGPGEPYGAFDLLDGVTNYDAYGEMGMAGYAGQDGVDAYHAKQTRWRDATIAHGKCAFVPSVTPGFNDRAVRDGHSPLSRKLSVDAAFGSMFGAFLANALTLVEDSTGSMVMITSFNEWHEDTQIEPVVSNGNLTDQPANRTCYSDNCQQLLEYEGYGELYLNLVRDATSSYM